jgi:PAS domain S-box-containing protein
MARRPSLAGGPAKNGPDPKISESRYHSLIDQASDFIMITDTEGNLFDVNASLCKTFGYRKQELLRSNISKLIDPVQLAADPIRFDLLLKGQTILRIRRMISKDGHIIEVEANVKMLPDGMVLAIARDLTERKLAKENIRQGETNFRLLIEQASDGIFISVPNGGIIDVNSYGCHLTGYSSHELLKMKIPDLFADEDLKKVPLRFTEILDGRSVLTERRLKRKDGVLLDVETNTKLLSDGRILGIMRDISERKLTEKTLRESENRFRNISEHAPIAIACYNHDRQNIFVNEKFVELTGYTLEDIPSTHDFTALVYPDDKYRQWVYDTWNNVDASGLMTGTGSSKIEVDIRCKDGGYKTVEATRALYNDLVYVIANDVTESRRAEQKILEQKIQEQKKLSRALLLGQEKERNKIGQELHDNVNQMLATIKLYLNMAKKRKEERGELIEKAEEYINSAIEEIRMLTKSHVAPRVSKTDLQELIQSLIDPLAESGTVDVSFDYANDHPYTLDDDLKLNLYRIVQEQLNNIQKYAMAKKVAVAVKIEKGIIRCSVSDNGKGFQVNRKRKGVGLSNIMSRVESFNGTVRIESSPGKGCTLEVEIPA